MAPFSQELEPPKIPGRFTLRLAVAPLVRRKDPVSDGELSNQRLEGPPGIRVAVQEEDCRASRIPAFRAVERDSGPELDLPEAKLSPVVRFGRYGPNSATASISTRKSGFARPEIKRSVLAGGFDPRKSSSRTARSAGWQSRVVT